MQKDDFLQNVASFSVFGGLKARTRSICDVSKQLDWLRIAAHVLQGALQAWEVSPWFTQMGLGMAGNGWKIHSCYTKLSDVPLPVGGLRLAGGVGWCPSAIRRKNCATPTKPTVSWKNTGLNWARGKSWMKWGTVAMDCHTHFTGDFVLPKASIFLVTDGKLAQSYHDKIRPVSHWVPDLVVGSFQ